MNATDFAKLMVTLGLNQQAMADALGVTQPLVSAMKSGKVAISSRTEKQLEQLRKEQVRKAHYTRVSKTLGREITPGEEL